MADRTVTVSFKDSGWGLLEVGDIAIHLSAQEWSALEHILHRRASSTAAEAERVLATLQRLELTQQAVSASLNGIGQFRADATQGATTQVINRKWSQESLDQLNQAFAETSERSSPMNEIALIAAKEWAVANAGLNSDPTAFGKNVALVAKAAAKLADEINSPDTSVELNPAEEVSSAAASPHSPCLPAGPEGPSAPISQLSNEGMCVQCISTICGPALCRRGS